MTFEQLLEEVKKFNPTPEQIEAFHKRLDESDKQFEEKERQRNLIDYNWRCTI